MIRSKKVMGYDGFGRDYEGVSGKIVLKYTLDCTLKLVLNFGLNFRLNAEPVEEFLFDETLSRGNGRGTNPRRVSRLVERAR